MELIIETEGGVRCIYGESIPLHRLGQISIRRGSHVEPDEAGNWHADMSPVKGPRLGPFETRSQALAAEIDWLAQNWLIASGSPQGFPSNPGEPVGQASAKPV